METQLYYIGASGIPEIIGQAAITGWGRGTVDSWARVSGVTSPTGKKVTYKKSASAYNSKYPRSGERSGGAYVTGSNSKVWIPATATKTVEGIERTVTVKYEVRGGYTYKRTKALKKKKKMLRYEYTYAKPYQYRKVYYDKPKKETNYITVEGSKFYAYFADIYYPNWSDDGGTITIGDSAATPNHLPHPSSVSVTYSDVNKNLNADNANNSSSRDNSGTYVFTMVRANLCTMELTWTGLSSNEGMELMAVLNSNESYKAQAGTTVKTHNNYLTVQYLDPVTNQPMTKVFYPSDRKIEKYGNGVYKTISVTLTEV